MTIVSEEPGVAGWVTIGGLSILDSANLSTAVTTFVTYKDWKERGSSLSQDHIVGSLRQKLAQIQEAFTFVVIPPPIRGLGQAGGFQMMVAGSGQPRLAGTRQGDAGADPHCLDPVGIGRAGIDVQRPHRRSSTWRSTAPRRSHWGCRLTTSSIPCKATWARLSSTCLTSSTRCSRFTSRRNRTSACSPRISRTSTSATTRGRWCRSVR